MHARHEISVKATLYSADSRRVLVMFYPRLNAYGLPGGHIDRNERAEVALARELQEELGVTVDNLERADFFFINRIILAYTAVVPDDFETFPPNPKREYAEWRTKEELLAIDNIAEEYKAFILERWPVAILA